MNSTAIFFSLIVLLSVVWFYTVCRSRTFLIVTIAWIIIQSVIALNGVYQVTDTLPPRLFLIGVLPALVMIALMFVTTKGRAFIDRLDLKRLTYFHAIRIPVEIILGMLCHQGLVARQMTIEGSNFDLISGVTAPIVAYLAFRNGVNRKLVLGWNILCLLLLMNVVITAVLALPSPIQQIAFDQPNVAVLSFPYNLLPSLVVPLVLFAHLSAFRLLTRKPSDLA